MNKILKYLHKVGMKILDYILDFSFSCHVIGITGLVLAFLSWEHYIDYDLNIYLMMAILLLFCYTGTLMSKINKLERLVKKENDK